MNKKGFIGTLIKWFVLIFIVAVIVTVIVKYPEESKIVGKKLLSWVRPAFDWCVEMGGKAMKWIAERGV